MGLIIKKLIRFFIRGYQLILSPWLGANCRYHPTCSQYALDCFEQLPWWKAAYFSVKRILRCHPWAEGGHDPIPTNSHSCPSDTHSTKNSRSNSKPRA